MKIIILVLALVIAATAVSLLLTTEHQVTSPAAMSVVKGRRQAGLL